MAFRRDAIEYACRCLLLLILFSAEFGCDFVGCVLPAVAIGYTEALHLSEIISKVHCCISCGALIER